MINNVCTVAVEDCSTSECANKRQLLRQKKDDDEEGEEEETASKVCSFFPPAGVTMMEAYIETKV